MVKLYSLHKLLPTIVATLVALLLLTPTLSHSQTVIPGPGGGATIVTPGGNTVLPPPGFPVGGPGTFPVGNNTGNPSGGGTVAPAGTTLTGQQADPQASPGNTQGSLETARELSGLNKLLYGFMVTIGGLFAWFGGLLLDTSLQFFVVEMGYRLANENFGFTVNAIWTIVRDLFNIIFIFALIFIGLKTILNSDDSSVKRDLGMLIVAALLINFSLLFTKMVVDFSNIAAIEIYNSFQVQGSGPTAALYQGFTNSNPSGGGGEIRSLSGVFMDHFNLPSYADTDTVRIAYDDSGLSGIFSWKVFSFGFLMMIMMIIAGFVFLAGAVLLIYRFVALVIYLMFSPVLFLGWIYPGFKSQSERYWRGFLRNAFVAPAYLFMLYICARLFEGMAGRTTMNFGNAFENAGSNFAVYAYFAVMIFFLIMATRVAGMMGAAGADVTARIGNYGVGMVRGAAMSPINYGRNLGRNLGGGLANTAYRNAPLVGGNAARESAERLAASQQRVREGTATFSDRARIAYQATRGAGSADARMATLNASANRAIGGGRSANQVAAAENTRNQAVAQRTARETVRQPATRGPLTGTYANLKRASKDQLKDIYQDSSLGAQFLQTPERALFLTDAQLASIDELVNDGTITTADRDLIRRRRDNARVTLSQGVDVGPVTPQSYFGNMSSSDIAQLDSAVLVNMANHDLLQISDLDAIMKSGRRNVDKAQIRNNILARAGAAGAPATVVQARTWLSGGAAGNGPGVNF